MTLNDAVVRALAANGPLASTLNQFKHREGQIEMARAVSQALSKGGILVVEAGTGIGKTFAYLVPALLSGQRVLISTATKALQDQLFYRDIPLLTAALALPGKISLLKGRSSYVCVQRLASARQDPRAMNPAALRHLALIENWAMATRSGDLAEVVGLDEESSVLPLVSSTRENCLGQLCPRLQQCHVNLARGEALAADVVVVNHHLFFADLNVRESGVAQLLPSVKAVIFDEAHQVNDIGVQFLGRHLTTGQLTALGRDLVIQGERWARGLASWHLMAMDLGRSTVALQQLCGSDATSLRRRRWSGQGPQGISNARWCGAMDGIQEVLAIVQARLECVAQIAPDLKKLHGRVSDLIAEVDHFSELVQMGRVRWLEVGLQVRMSESPLDIAQAMQAHVLRGQTDPESSQSWIFTSATLGSENEMAVFAESCGLAGAKLLHVPSPFDYARQSSIYVPEHMPQPNEASHSEEVARLAADSAAVLGGRTLVLTTSVRAMHAIGRALHLAITQHSKLQVLIQGQSSKRELLRSFDLASSRESKGAILVASASFWEGVDIPGDALQLLIIDKLPFSPPDDPLMEARLRQLEAGGKNAFMHFQVPQAALALKQGAGRLIRTETDRGVLVVCDVRLTQKGYGRQILAALPPMKRISTQPQFAAALDALTKPSTTDPFLS